MFVTKIDAASNSTFPIAYPLYVDLDGTLIKSDMLIESLLVLIKQQPLAIFLIPFWLLRGKAYLKQQIAQRVSVNCALLPYHGLFLEYLKAEAASGRRIILATASDRRLAQSVASHLGFFAHVLASDGETNLKGHGKLDAILSQCADNAFGYAGNAHVDVPILSRAHHAILVNPDKGVREKLSKSPATIRIFEERVAGLMPYLKALRVHQWLKNVLLFVPLITAHQWGNPSAIANVLLAFVSFSLTASSMYVLNDLLDLSSDRAHPRKRKRPFAAGDIPLARGGVLMLVALTLGVLLAMTVSWAFTGILLFYLTVTLAYSWHLKTFVLIDVMVLAGLYTLRVIAGAIAISVTPSFWLLAFSIFVFLSLALVKRCTELITVQETNGTATRGRDYRVSDLDYLRSMGTASGYLSVLVLALFINSTDVATRYSHPQVLWLLCPAVLYWISRIWIKAGRNEVDDDPLVFSIRDRGSRYVLLFTVVVAMLAV